jgi:hypothetical protein
MERRSDAVLIKRGFEILLAGQFGKPNSQKFVNSELAHWFPAP